MAISEELKILQQLPALQKVKPGKLKMIAMLCDKHEFDAGSYLIQEGEQVDKLYVVLEGSIEFLVAGQQRDISLLQEVIHDPRAVGALAVLADRPQMHSVRATTRTIALSIPTDTVIDLVRENPEIAFQALRVFAERYDKFVRRLREAE
jgi:CRP-like cAMP-binding protein